MPPISFLDLPRELRDKIYLDYVTPRPDRIYVYDYESNKLRLSDNQPIDLALMYTCKQIADEMSGLALRANTVIFKTVYSDELRPALGRFNYLYHQYIWRMGDVFIDMLPTMSFKEMESVTSLYPEVMQALRAARWSPGRPDIYYPTLDHEALALALQTWLRLHPCSDWWARRRYQPHLSKTWWDTISIMKVASLDLKPWAVPSKSELDEIMEVTASSPKNVRTEEWWETHDGGKYRLSAAAAAIRFFDSIPHARRTMQARILLDEDRISVAFPECHGTGLIPFCQENPRLVFTRRASLWYTMVFHRGRTSIPMWSKAFPRRESEDAEIGNIIRVSQAGDGVEAWMVEAAKLQRKGMPPDQFILLLDGRPAPHQARKLFKKVVHRNVAFHEATLSRVPEDERELCIARHRMASSWRHVFRHPEFPRLLRELVHDRMSGAIRCNFNPGRLEDPKTLFTDLEEWVWTTFPPISYEGRPLGITTEPPLPPWRDMMLANMVDWFELKLEPDLNDDVDDDDSVTDSESDFNSDDIYSDEDEDDQEFSDDEEMWLTLPKSNKSTIEAHSRTSLAAN